MRLWNFPYRLGQIGLVGNTRDLSLPLQRGTPYRLGQIGLVGNLRGQSVRSQHSSSLPIGSNRISWKHETLSFLHFLLDPTDWVKSD